MHAVNVEGTGTGVDEDLLKILAKESEIPITYAGGIGSYEDIEIIQKTGKTESIIRLEVPSICLVVRSNSTQLLQNIIK